MAFAIVTQLQFNHRDHAKIQEASKSAYNTALSAYNTCVMSIETRETYRGIFTGIELLFEKTAQLPVDIFPGSEEAKAYHDALFAAVAEFITNPVKDELPPKLASDCPPKPEEP